MAPTVSVVIPTYNRAPLLERLLRALAAQADVAAFEVIVADDGSTDATREVVGRSTETYGQTLRWVEAEQNTGPAGARNRGWRAASAPLVAFIDDDVVPEPRWLASLVEGLAESDIAWGRLTMPPEQRELIGPFSHWGEGGDDGHYDTANIAYRREVLEALGGFDEGRFRYQGRHGTARCINGEDTDLGVRARKAGYRGTYRADAVAVHDVAASSWPDHLRDMRRMEGLVLLFSRHPELREALGKGWFYRSVDKAVLLAWPALLAAAIRPRRLRTTALLGAATGLYVWQFRKAHPDPRGAVEWMTAVPLGFVSDTYAVVVMARASLRHRTLLL